MQHTNGPQNTLEATGRVHYHQYVIEHMTGYGVEREVELGRVNDDTPGKFRSYDAERLVRDLFAVVQISGTNGTASVALFETGFSDVKAARTKVEIPGWTDQQLARIFEDAADAEWEAVTTVNQAAWQVYKDLMQKITRAFEQVVDFDGEPYDFDALTYLEGHTNSEDDYGPTPG